MGDELSTGVRAGWASRQRFSGIPDRSDTACCRPNWLDKKRVPDARRPERTREGGQINADARVDRQFRTKAARVVVCAIRPVSGGLQARISGRQL